jgi:hypothetical protein
MQEIAGQPLEMTLDWKEDYDMRIKAICLMERVSSWR